LTTNILIIEASEETPSTILKGGCENGSIHKERVHS
jgi:hypothetical protein